MRAFLASDISPGTDDHFLRTVGGVAVWGAVTAATIGAAPATRAISTGTGLSGGGDLSADRTLTWDGLGVQKDGAAVGTRRNLNIIGGRAEVTDDSGGSGKWTSSCQTRP